MNNKYLVLSACDVSTWHRVIRVDCGAVLLQIGA